MSGGDMIGPQMPSQLLSGGDASDSGNGEDKDASSGPMASSTSGRRIGPSLPPPAAAGSSDSSSDSDGSEVALGPALPPGLVQGPSAPAVPAESSDEDDVIGPMPGEEGGVTLAQLEHRARRTKNREAGETTETGGREEWMLELPKVMGKEYGLTAKKKFRQGAGVNMGDRSVWTDTPQDKLRKAKEGPTERPHSPDFGESERDTEMDSAVQKYNKSRAESLLELHKKKLKKELKKAKKKEKKRKKDKKKGKNKEKPTATRVPFNRDNDLKLNKFDKAMKDAYIKKSQGLTNKFSHGKTKFV